MIIIRIFSSFKTTEPLSLIFIRGYELEYDSDFNTKYKFTEGDDYTHVLLLNTAMPRLNKINIKNVIGLTFEPSQFLGITNEFINYVNKNVGKYYIDQTYGKLNSPFYEHFSYLPHTIDLKNIKTNKTKIMSIMISQKTDAPGHKYRHILTNAILRTNLPIDIYGRGCNFYNNVNDNRIKGKFHKNEMYNDYKFHVCIENFSTPHYFSEKIINPLRCNTTPIYWGCKNIHSYFGDTMIILSGDVSKDIEILKQICEKPEKYAKNIDTEIVKKTTNIKNVINEWL
tara:strand:+ start:3143 stop:3994 length:852 start_codon:yes stop_codon:yes gene_type:complete